MAALLSICIKEGRREVILFLFEEGVKPAEIICRMQAQYDDSCLLRSKIYEWIERFKQGIISFCDEERSGRSSTSTSEDNVQVVQGWKKWLVSSAGITPSANKKRINALLDVIR
ncbi:hypothetical protein TNCV_3798171 [Trichonephila clavipes]|nr:hypothetical protein TNCV_3798171 [Trichonephila clavipes]